jgi:hypothetical protein
LAGLLIVCSAAGLGSAAGLDGAFTSRVRCANIHSAEVLARRWGGGGGTSAGAAQTNDL